VVDHEGHLIGIVTRGDIRGALPSETQSLGEWELNYLVPRITVKHIMTPHPITAYTTDSIVKAATLMMEHKVSGLPVVTPADRQLVGIITESDIFDLVVQTWEEETSHVSTPAQSPAAKK
jgi:CBS domain-containing protein